ncbi:MAG: TSUP family transporter [Gammaproteobacteria bacterium]
MMLHPTVERVTERIAGRSRASRADYLARMDAAREAGPARLRLSCGNLAHGFAAAGPDKPMLRAGRGGNLGIVTAYNDMLSAHQPFEPYPSLIRAAARNAGGSAQVAGGVPAMCDGVTQGRAGMELSLFSRDTIALATAVALSHDMFDGALLLGVCDKIVPGLLVGALAGSLTVRFLDAAVLRLLFGLFACGVALWLVFGREPAPRSGPARFTAVIAAAIGCFAALVGVGGGILLVPWLLARGATPHQAVGTSAMATLPVAAAGGVGYMLSGQGVAGLPDHTTGFVLWPAVAGMAAGALLAARWGVAVAHRTSAQRLRRVFALLVAAMGLDLVFT